MIERRKKPNILFILTDDQGVWSLGSYGNTEIITPNIDMLASKGVKFDNFFCASPVCSPARASILTGKLPSQHGIIDWLGGGSVDKREYEGLKINIHKSQQYLAKKTENLDMLPEDTKIGYNHTLNYQNYMNYEHGGIDYMKEHLTYTEVLKENGYICGLVGKWHLGNSKVPQKGFTYWQVVPRGGTDYFLTEYVRNGNITIEERYVTDIITDDAIRFIEENSKSPNPFYLSLHYTAPHDPWEEYDQPEEVWNLYKECKFDYLPDEPLHPWQVSNRTQPNDVSDRKYYARGYYTCMTAMDKSIGRVIKKLEELEILDNTIILYTSDNGFNLGHHGIWGKGNGTFPLNMYDTSIKVPFIAYYKNEFSEGIERKELISHYDIFPTILDLCGCLNDRLRSYINNLPGSSFKNLLYGLDTSIRDSVMIYDEYGPTRMIRTDKYKYIYRIPYGPNELYDLQIDSGERNNLINNPDYIDIRVNLHEKLDKWFVRFVDPRYDGTKFPVDGEGQFERLENYNSIKKVFKKF